MKKIRSFLALVLSLSLLVGCTTSNQETTPPTAAGNETEYSVTVTDRDGAPVDTAIIVNFLSEGNVVAMQPVGKDGVAKKSLPTGEYTVTLSFVDTAASFESDLAENTVLTADAPSLTVKLFQGLWGSTTISAYSEADGDYRDFEAKNIGTGTTRVPLDAANRTYILFAPTESGLYSFSVDNGDVTLGYYGAPHLVQQWSVAEYEEDGSFNVSIADSMIGTEGTGTTVLVLGLDAGGAESCFVTIQRIGDPIKTIEDYEWEIYQGTTKPAPYILPEGIELHEFDLKAATDAYTLVFNETDQLYHLNSADGPIVFFKLGVDSAYLDSFQTILETSGINRYFFDENGDFLKKVTYSECLLEYIACMDEASGLYPLTDDLMHILQQRGEYVGWWDPNNSIYLFVDSNGNRIPGINHEIAWLFNCCYGELPAQQPTEPESEPKPDTPTEPTEPPRTVGQESPDEEVAVGLMEEFTATVRAGEHAKYMIYRVVTTVYLTIESEDAYVIYKNKVYWPENGVVTVVLKGTPMNNSMALSIGNSGDEDVTFTVRLGNPKGAQTNPYTLAMGKNSVSLEKDNEIGAYFVGTAEKAGLMTVTVNKVSNKAAARIVINVTTGDITAQYSLEGSDPITISVNAGDKLELIVCAVDPNNAYNHPAATIDFTLAYNN